MSIKNTSTRRPYVTINAGNVITVSYPAHKAGATTDMISLATHPKRTFKERFGLHAKDEYGKVLLVNGEDTPGSLFEKGLRDEDQHPPINVSLLSRPDLNLTGVEGWVVVEAAIEEVKRHGDDGAHVGLVIFDGLPSVNGMPRFWDWLNELAQLREATIVVATTAGRHGDATIAVEQADIVVHPALCN